MPNKLESKPGIFQIALLGGETLLGRDLQEVFETQLKQTLVTSYAATGEGNFGESEGEAIYLDPFDANAAAAVDAIVTAGAAAGALKAYALAKTAPRPPAIIDCSGHLEQEPEARIVSPIAGEPNPAGVSLFVTAQPAAAAITATLGRLARYRPIAVCSAHIFEPASERGKAGASELHQQTSDLLAFRGLDKEIYDAQLGFNLLAQYGPAAPLALAAVERRIERHLQVLLANAASPMPSIRLIQAPTFHAYSISLWVEFAAAISLTELTHSLASAQIVVREASEETPNSVAASGQSEFLAGDIRIDRNNPRAVWLWLVCDNLRVTASIASTLLQSIKREKA